MRKNAARQIWDNPISYWQKEDWISEAKLRNMIEKQL